MTTLYKRASPGQAQALRIIAGAVLNTHDAHPGKYRIDARFARGVAKRAVGTLSAQLADTLAAGISRPSETDGGHHLTPSQAGDTLRISGKRPAQYDSRSMRASESESSLALIKRAEKALRRLVNPARANGQQERADALIEALTVMGRLQKTAEREASQ